VARGKITRASWANWGLQIDEATRKVSPARIAFELKTASGRLLAFADGTAAYWREEDKQLRKLIGRNCADSDATWRARWKSLNEKSRLEGLLAKRGDATLWCFDEASYALTADAGRYNIGRLILGPSRGIDAVGAIDGGRWSVPLQGRLIAALRARNVAQFTEDLTLANRPAILTTARTDEPSRGLVFLDSDESTSGAILEVELHGKPSLWENEALWSSIVKSSAVARIFESNTGVLAVRGEDPFAIEWLAIERDARTTSLGTIPRRGGSRPHWHALADALSIAAGRCRSFSENEDLQRGHLARFEVIRCARTGSEALTLMVPSGPGAPVGNSVPAIVLADTRAGDQVSARGLPTEVLTAVARLPAADGNGSLARGYMASGRSDWIFLQDAAGERKKGWLLGRAMPEWEAAAVSPDVDLGSGSPLWNDADLRSALQNSWSPCTSRAVLQLKTEGFLLRCDKEGSVPKSFEYSAALRGSAVDSCKSKVPFKTARFDDGKVRGYARAHASCCIPQRAPAEWLSELFASKRKCLCDSQWAGTWGFCR
jgi:hypothetical protein